MKIKSLKSVLKFWQEIVFIIGLGILVGGITMNISYSFQYTINIVFYSLFVLLLICLIGQLYWKNWTLALCLSAILGIGSFYMFMAVVSDLVKMTNLDPGLIFGLFLFLGLVGIAITMPIKYLKIKNKEE
jgi:uncharacterized membrane protein